MSILWNELITNRPEWPMAPDALERAWQWMEAQGFGRQSPSGYVLTPGPDEGEGFCGPVFSPNLRLDGWCTPENPAHARLLPIAEVAGDGSVAALWRDDQDHIRVVTLESEGGGYLIADSEAQFCALVAMGYGELTELGIDGPPESPEAVAGFRAWVEHELQLQPPEQWPAVGDDAFSAWLDAQLGTTPPGPPVPTGPGITITGAASALLGVIGTADGPEAAAKVGQITGTTLGTSLRASTAALHAVGLEVEVDRTGVSTIWITLERYPHPDDVIVGIEPGASCDSVRARLGDPEAESNDPPWLRYICQGRYLHLDFAGGGLGMVTVMRTAP